MVGDAASRLRLRAHADTERFQALQHHPGVERAHGAAGVLVEGVQVIVHVLGRAQHDAAEHAALAVDMLGRGIDHHVGPEL